MALRSAASANASLPTDLTVSGSLILIISESAKARSPISVTGRPPSFFGTVTFFWAPLYLVILMELPLSAVANSQRAAVMQLSDVFFLSDGFSDAELSLSLFCDCDS